ncbi:hypothetical protein F2Q68_00007160 [Brassica cretica]|uniref:Flavin-containing monooxygenase n=1 Tax=Brassica cretica TaxID=69181 RepID=A0A8S9KRK3_BRACR|nr:hypothetical protein F2Q68_00007160 [Brassica cretica]
MVSVTSSEASRNRSKKVCVIGAGPSGLVSARELRKEGHKVVVMEQNNDVGGQWLYQPNVKEEDPLGSVPTNGALKVHSSIYSSLRLTSPREIMGYSDFPFLAKKGRDMRRFPGHKELWLYLKDFSEAFGVREMTRFNVRVEFVGEEDKNEDVRRWIVRSREKLSGKVIEEIFDAVVVATGHYSHPRLPSIKVLGYSYKFPFLESKGRVEVDDDRVGPLFEHTFPPSLSPSLSFVGIPRKLIGFPFFEAQAKWIAQVLSGKLSLPSSDHMLQSVADFYRSRDLAGVPKHNTHDIADFTYCDKYADYVGFPHLEEWRKLLCLSALDNSQENLETYRDSWDDHELLQEAMQSSHFTNYNS